VIACSSEFVWVVGESGNVHGWSGRIGAPLVTRTYPDPIQRLVAFPDGYELAAIDDRGLVHLTHAPDGRTLASCSNDGMVRLWRECER
jgi:hypothetical protein